MLSCASMLSLAEQRRAAWGESDLPFDSLRQSIPTPLVSPCTLCVQGSAQKQDLAGEVCHLPKPPPQCTRREGRTFTKGLGFLAGSAVARAGARLSSPGRRCSPLPLSFRWGLGGPGDTQRKEAFGRCPPTGTLDARRGRGAATPAAPLLAPLLRDPKFSATTGQWCCSRKGYGPGR